METIRQRVANAGLMHPVAPTKIRGNTPIYVSSPEATPPPARAPPAVRRNRVIIDSDDDEQPRAAPAPRRPNVVDSDNSGSSEEFDQGSSNAPIGRSEGRGDSDAEYSHSDEAPSPDGAKRRLYEKGPPFPVPHPFRPPQAASTLNFAAQKPDISSSSHNQYDTSRPVPFGSSAIQNGAKFAPATKSMPWDASNATTGPDGDMAGENFEVGNLDNVYEPRMNADDADKAMRDLVESSLTETTENIDMAEAIVDGFRANVKLLPHQVVAKLWMQEREAGKKRGGILADDMGLGKTVQALTRIVGGKPTKDDRRDGWAPSTLIVCPPSLVGQWASEIKKYCEGGLRVVEHHGSSRTRDPDTLARCPIVITTYATLSSEHGAFLLASGDAPPPKKSKGKAQPAFDLSDSDGDFGRTLTTTKPTTTRKKKAGHDALMRVQWWRVVLDEAQNIKNRSAKMSIACCALVARNRWVLTGTPLQNTVDELYSFFRFLQIRPLDDWRTFNEQISKPVKAGRTVRAMKRLQVVLKAVMLRRTKATILNGQPIIDLPGRVVEVMPCEFDEDERVFYSALEDKTSKIFEKIVQQGDVMKNYTSVLVMLLRLRQACGHPALVAKDYQKDADALESREKNDDDELADMFSSLKMDKALKCSICQTPLDAADRGPNCSDCELNIAIQARRRSTAKAGSNLPPSSAKIRKILELLEMINDKSEGDDKTIIFSQFTSMMDIIEPFLKDEGIKYVRYDGSMNPAQRTAAIEKIKTSKSTKVILISFKAGGTGLNLTCCNNVILVDLWWNPALEDQAFDRAHRFGQTKDVNIYKLMIEKTVEERILALQDTKRALATAALSGDKIKNSKLGRDDIMALFRLGHDDDDDEP